MADPELRLLIAQLTSRPADSHKGSFGRALILGGSRGMAGAAALAGMGALRGGAGLVTVAVPRSILTTVAALNPCYMTAPLAEDDGGRISMEATSCISDLLLEATAVACGPGLSQSPELATIVRALYEGFGRPAVFDADALNILAGAKRLPKADGPRILTPHPGEFARLIQRKIEGRAAQCEAATHFAAQCGVVVVLKGHQTFITDGARTAVNETGNPGMATGGTGDVLTGLITALLCQGLAPFDAARAAVYLHGRAGDLAAQRFGQVAMIATDVINALGEAVRG